MDKIWLDAELDLQMTPYKVIGTGCEQGYLEFVGNSVTIAFIQYEKGILKTFSDNTLEKYMIQEIENNEAFTDEAQREE
jgi:phosphatidylinositol kinase/protein kinase (PI-3  family)